LPNPKDLADSANTPKPLNIALSALFAIAFVSNSFYPFASQVTKISILL